MECTGSVKIFKARAGAPFKKDEAQVIGETLDSIRVKYGGKLKTEDIVLEAKEVQNPLHEHFEWDNDEAGEKYRLQQARMITSHIVEEVVISGNKEEQRSFLSISNSEKQNVYVSLEDATTVVDYRTQLLNRMINILENLTLTMKLFREKDSSK